MSQQDFARAMGITSGALSNIYSERSRPTANHVSGIHLAFPEVSVNWLMFGEGEMFVKSAGAKDRQSEESGASTMAVGAARIGNKVPAEVAMPIGVREDGLENLAPSSSSAVATLADTPQSQSRGDSQEQDGMPLVDFALAKKPAAVALQPDLFDVVADEGQQSSVPPVAKSRPSASSSADALSSGGGKKIESLAVAPDTLAPEVEASRLAASQQAATIALETPTSATRNIYTSQRRISEIKIFYSDGTYETFLPSR